MNYFEGKQIVITGASSGIGAEFSRQLHLKGANLVLIARRLEKLEQLASDFNKQRAGSATCLQADLSSSPDLNRVSQVLTKERCDILINNAGRGSFNYFHKLALEEELQMVELNICAGLRLAHAVIPQMIERRSGAIVTVSSIAGFQPLPFMSTYAATKAFNLFHSYGLSQELSQFGIRVMAVCPGPTATEFAGVARVPGTVTAMSRDSVEMVVSKSIAALQAGCSHVVPGWQSSLTALLSRFAPMKISTALVRRALKPVLDSAAKD